MRVERVLVERYIVVDGDVRVTRWYQTKQEAEAAKLKLESQRLRRRHDNVRPR